MASGNMKDIRRRIKSVESTMQITKAMQLVASSKLRKAKEKADKARPYFNELYETMCEITRENPKFLSPFTKSRDGGTALIIVTAGERGLAGGFNSSVFKAAQARIDELGGAEHTEILAIGKKSVEYFEKRGFKMYGSFSGIAESITIYRAEAIASGVVDAYVRGVYNRVELFYTEFVSPLTQTAARKALLPVETDISAKKDGARSLPIYEPSAADVFNHIVPRYVTGMLFGAIVDRRQGGMLWKTPPTTLRR